MAIQFTKQQQKVIHLNHRNILVSAAAGSGKTAVLVERIINMVCQEDSHIDIDRLLIVTFTKAAAAEMRERISLGIADRLALYPENEHIQKQSTLLHNAQITTIDSFCMFLIRNHFNVIGLDPSLRVADEGEIRLLRQDVMDQLLEKKFAGEYSESGEEEGGLRDAFIHCVEFFCPGGREKVLEKYILDIHQYAESCPWPQEWLKERKEDYNGASALVEEWLLSHLKNMLEGCFEIMEKVIRLCQEPDGPYMYGELAEKEADMLKALINLGSLSEYEQKLPAVVFGRLPSKKDESVTPSKREGAKRLRKLVKDTLADLEERFFGTPLPLGEEQAAACREPVEMLLDLVLEFDKDFRERKQEKKILDYADMEHYALNILLQREGEEMKAGWVAKEYRQYFHEILIDEYQDSNLVQEYLLKAVSGEEEGRYNRFMVGDVKQSIYKFRLARPELFLEKYKEYTQEESDCQRIDLSMNFRSRREVINSVNGVFSRIMNRKVGGIDYDEKAALHPGASYPEKEDCVSELLLIENPGSEEELNKKQAEAHVIAMRIKELHRDFQVTDKLTGQLRPVKYSDMVILLRTTSGWDEEFKRVLEEEGIPAHITSKTGYFDASEVQELLQLLRVLDNPCQDIPLFGVMKSVFGGFREEEIARLRSQKKEGSLYHALIQGGQEAEDIPEEGVFTLQKKCKKLLLAIEKYRGYTVYMPIRELLTEIVRDYDYLSYVTAMPGGNKRRGNVEMLFTKASDFEKTSYFGLFHFIRYIEQLEKYDQDFGEAELLDENADVVRIMSIHKSKGLEFGVAIVAGLSKRFNMQDLNKALVVDMDLGLGTDYVNPVRRIRNKTLRRMVIARKMKEDNLSEELRILYVAMTRAREKLILSATMEKAGEVWEEIREMGDGVLTYPEFMAAGSYMDFLLPVISQAEIEVRLTDTVEAGGARWKEQVQLYEQKSRLERVEEYMDVDALKQLKERFSYQYPQKFLQKLYTKTTVSELKIAAMAEKDEMAYHAFEQEEVKPYIPAFRRNQEKISGTVRGNAFHRVMELFHFERLYQQIFPDIPNSPKEFQKGINPKMLSQNLKSFLEREKAEKRLSEEYYEAVSQEKLLHFLESDISYRMWRAERKGHLYREQPFVLGISADRLSEEFPQEEKVLIQGIIDAYFIEEGELVLLDYKTDVINTPRELWDRYEVQLAYYEEALCRLTALPMKEKLLYSFYLEQCVKEE